MAKSMTTEGVVVPVIRENLLSIAEADDIKHRGSTRYRFHLRIESFSDAVGGIGICRKDLSLKTHWDSCLGTLGRDSRSGSRPSWFNIIGLS